MIAYASVMDCQVKHGNSGKCKQGYSIDIVQNPEETTLALSLGALFIPTASM